MPDTTAPVTRRIRLEVTSPAAHLPGIANATKALERLNVQLILAGDMISELNGATGFSRMGHSAEAAASRANVAISSIGRSTRTAITDLNRVTRVGGRTGSPGGRSSGGGVVGMEKAVQSLTPAGLAKNIVTATGWMAAYGAVLKLSEGVRYSTERMMALERQTAVLRQTFRGVGGNASQLTDDVLKLAAAEGRGSEEAMKAATHWTRLGFDRRQTIEATRVSLIAANVSEMSAGDATERLSSLMSAYNLSASELNGTLGMLSRTSQTYRVTNSELLNGLSRVSNIAKQSGMSLAELQGTLGLLVQKTGLSGERVANALQIFLNRINNPGVQEMIERRYKTQLTGNAGDFSKIYAIYQRVSDEEKKLIRTQVGTPRQSNVFSALMEIYPEIRNAAISSLTHMDAALQENIKVTNTAAAAAERLKSSWDRMVNSPLASGVAAGAMNVWSGQIQAANNLVGNISSKKKPHYNNPEGADMWGFFGAPGLALMKPAEWAAHVLGNKKQEAFWKSRNDLVMEHLGQSENPTQPDDTFQVESQGIQIHTNLAESHRLSAEAAKEAGNSKLQKQEEALQQQELKYAKIKQQAQITQLKYELSLVKAESEQLPILSKLTEAQGKLVRLNYDEGDGIDRTEMRMEQMTRVMTGHRLLAEDIAATLKGIGLPKWVEESVSTAGQLAVTRSMISSGEKRQAVGGADGDYWPQTLDALRKEALNLEMRQQYQSSAVGSYYTHQQTAIGVSSKMAGFEIEGHGAGYTEGEKLLDKRKWLGEEQSKLGHVEKLDRDQLVRASMIMNSLRETELGIQSRILVIDRERKQVMIDTQREFRKSLITAGPGDILRKLATASLMKGGRNAGQFFSMSGEMRGDAYNLMGGEGMARLNAEGRALRGQKLSVSGVQGLAENREKWSAKFGAALESRLSVGADVAAKSMNRASGAADLLASAAEHAARVLNTISGDSSARTLTTPSAAPVPQSFGSHGSTVTDFGSHGWSPNPAQRAATESAGVK